MERTICHALIVLFVCLLLLTCAEPAVAKRGTSNQPATAEQTKLLERCEAMRRQNRAQEALVLLDAANRASPGSAGIYDARAACYLDLDNLDRAEVDLDMAVKTAGKSDKAVYAQRYTILAERYRKKLEPDKVRAVLDKYVKSAGTVDAYCARAQLLRERGQIAAAFADLDKAISLRPNETKALEQKALTASKSRHYKEAIDCYSRLIKLSTGQPVEALRHTYGGRGFCYNKLGQHEKAIPDLSVALRGGFDRRTLLSRANSYQALKQYHRALADADTLLRKEPANVTAFDLKISMLEKLGKTDQALAGVNKLINRYPSSSQWYRRRAQIFKAIGKPDKAKVDLEKAQKLEKFIE
jgi:tetratricopeptide (TPR) repeat protein